MKMRDENLALIEANMFLPEDQRKPMTERQEQLLKEVTDCYNLQLQKPMASRTYLRNYLMKKYKVSKVQAYNIIIYAAVLLGNVQASHKNWVRQRIEFLAEQAYLDRPTYLKGVAVGFVLRQTAELFCKIDREVPFLASVQGFYTYAERLRDKRNDLSVGHTSAFPL